MLFALTVELQWLDHLHIYKKEVLLVTNNNETENVRTVSWEKEEAMKQNLDSEMTPTIPKPLPG